MGTFLQSNEETHDCDSTTVWTTSEDVGFASLPVPTVTAATVVWTLVTGMTTTWGAGTVGLAWVTP
jgi:hypothetical protein